jgi:hypothetical protein
MTEMTLIGQFLKDASRCSYSRGFRGCDSLHLHSIIHARSASRLLSGEGRWLYGVLGYNKSHGCHLSLVSVGQLPLARVERNVYCVEVVSAMEVLQWLCGHGNKSRTISRRRLCWQYLSHNELDAASMSLFAKLSRVLGRSRPGFPPAAPRTSPVLDEAYIVEEQTLPRYDSLSYYPMRLGDTLSDKYQIVSIFGFGTSSTV